MLNEKLLEVQNLEIEAIRLDTKIKTLRRGRGSS